MKRKKKLNIEGSDWPELLGKKPKRPTKETNELFGKTVRRSKDSADRDYEPATEAHLNKFSKKDLIAEVIRLQNNERDCAVELGIARKSISSEFVIHPDFVSRIMSIIKSSWSSRI